MHNYSVANRYNTKTKLGNWYEQIELDNHNFKEYLYQKDQGNNLNLTQTQKLSYAHQPVSLSEKGTQLAAGQNVQLFNHCTQGILAFNVNEPILGEQTYAVTTTKQTAPALRNVLTLQHAKADNQGPIRFGDKIRLTARANNRKLYLQSLPMSPMRSSKFNRLQEVSVTAELNSNSLWTIEKLQARQRFDSIGTELSQEEPFVLKHIGTGQWLASDCVKYINQFGAEFEVSAHSYLSTNKTQNLFAEKEGHRSIENTMRSQAVQNTWHFIRG